MYHFKSFEMLDFWMEEFIQAANIETIKNFPYVVLGNKLDLDNKFVLDLVDSRLNLRELISGVGQEEILHMLR